MGFLKKLFGGGEEKPYVDKNGIYFYAVCDNCKTAVKVRANKSSDLNNNEDGFVWHKTIVDSTCFRPMHAVVQLDRKYKVISEEVENGRFVTEAVYEEMEAARIAPKPIPDTEEE